MALPPTIPTSFVPKQPVTTAPKKRASGANPFLALSYLALGISIIAAGLTFGYQFYLEGLAKKKANDVVVAQRQIDQATVTQFIRLRDRFTAGKTVLDQHIVMSQLLDTIENLTLQNVSFNKLSVTVADDRNAQMSLSGTARSFNALAGESTAFGSDARIKHAIFSGIATKDTGIGFEIRAAVDPSLLRLSPSAVPMVAPQAAAPAATTSAATTTP